MRRSLLLYSTMDVSAVESHIFASALQRLPMLLQQQPTRIDISVALLGGQHYENVFDVLEAHGALSDKNATLQDNLADDFEQIPGVVIACSSEHALACAVRESNPLARWGGTCGEGKGPLSIVWHLEDEYTIWHECLHLLGAVDCYDEVMRHSICPLHNCIMQYEPSMQSVGDWPFLCDTNVHRMRVKYGVS